MISQIFNGARRALTLPLIARELTEAASRRRTYIVRVLYASLLFIFAIFFSYDVLFPTGDRFNVLGRGDELFLTVVLTQFAGIYLFLPAMTCAAITSEKERNTLGLLFLTRLSPVKIIVEKFLSRVVPMLSLLLLSLPLFGIAYTLGGLESGLIWEGVVRLGATTAMVGAVGIAASSWCRTTAGAFFLTYTVLLAFFPGFPFIISELFAGPGPNTLITAIDDFFINLGLVSDVGGRGISASLFFGPGFPLLESISGTRGIPPGTTLFTSAWRSLWQATPLLFMALLALAVGRIALVRRAEVKPKRYIIRLFRWIDASFRAANERYAHGIEIIKSRDANVGDEPIAWRETTKTPLGSFRYLVRILLVVEVPVLIVGLLAVGERGYNVTEGLIVFTIFLWLGAGLLIAVKGATLFPMERSRETIGVLLTTTIPTREILRQKLTGLGRLIAICAIPLITLFWMFTYLAEAMDRHSWPTLIGAFASMVCAMATSYLLVAYSAVLVGLRTQRLSRAVMASVSLFVGACLAGPILYIMFSQGDVDDAFAPGSPFSLYSPLTTLVETLDTPFNLSRIIPLIIGTLTLHGGLALIARNLCYRQAALYLGRGDEIAPPKLAPPRGEASPKPLLGQEVSG